LQTFLPYASFEDSAAVLDNRRLGKQRVEGTQILTILLTPNYRGAWRNHPAVRMWRGYEEALRLYINAVVTEWIGRGYRNSLATYDLTGRPIVFPFWLGDPRLHDSHKSNLLRKDFSYYSQFGWDVPPDLPYYWPV
jgi:hypothetical protein